MECVGKRMRGVVKLCKGIDKAVEINRSVGSSN